MVLDEVDVKAIYSLSDFVATLSLNSVESTIIDKLCAWKETKEVRLLKDIVRLLSILEDLSIDSGRSLLSLSEISGEVVRFSDVRELGDLERSILHVLCSWDVVEDLEEARQLLFFMLDEADAD